MGDPVKETDDHLQWKNFRKNEQLGKEHKEGHCEEGEARQQGRQSWPQEGVGRERTPLRSIHAVFTF